MAINTFVDYSNGIEFKAGSKKHPPGPKPIYNTDPFLVELKRLIDRGETIETMRKVLGVSHMTIDRGKKYLRNEDTQKG